MKHNLYQQEAEFALAAAGYLLVEEAEGRVTDLDGRDLDFATGVQLINNRGVLASNGHLHEVGLAAIL